jgi:hypothetical protein
VTFAVTAYKFMNPHSGAFEYVVATHNVTSGYRLSILFSDKYAKSFRTLVTSDTSIPTSPDSYPPSLSSSGTSAVTATTAAVLPIHWTQESSSYVPSSGAPAPLRFDQQQSSDYLSEVHHHQESSELWSSNGGGGYLMNVVDPNQGAAGLVLPLSRREFANAASGDGTNWQQQHSWPTSTYPQPPPPPSHDPR